MKIETLQNLLNEDELFLICDIVSRKYLTDFHSSDGFLLIDKNSSVFLVDARYFEDAQKKVKYCECVLFNSFDDVRKQIGGNIKNIIFGKNCVTLAQFEKFKKLFEGKNVISDERLDKILEDMRSRKNSDEINCLKKAQKITEDAFIDTIKFIRSGMSELEIAAFLEYRMRIHGSQGISFDTIVVSGKSGSVPHGVPTYKKVENGDFVTMDFGATFNSYHSDMTRTVVVGKASERQKDIYNIVLEAQNEAIKTIKSGMICSKVDNTARDVIKKAGFGDYFCHSTGHGVGLKIHEYPSVSQKSNSVLKTGNVITIEPGIYIPNEFGVRIEDFGVVTEDGFDNFTSAPKNLIEL